MFYDDEEDDTNEEDKSGSEYHDSGEEKEIYLLNQCLGTVLRKFWSHFVLFRSLAVCPPFRSKFFSFW